MEKSIREKIIEKINGNLEITDNPNMLSDMDNIIINGGTIEDKNYGKIGHYEAIIYFVMFEEKWYKVVKSGEIIDIPNDEQPTWSDEIEIEETTKEIITEWFVEPLSYEKCLCESPNHNYPEMVWCDNCGKEI
jgi:hypothetical protein